LGVLLALEWAWHAALIVSEISAFIRTDGQTDMARSIRLVVQIKYIYTLWGRKLFLLPVTYFMTNLVYPFTLRVMEYVG